MPQKSKWDTANFIALDGEGENEGDTEIFNTSEKRYTARVHKYTLLAASTGESLYRGGKRLDSFDILDWLCDLGDEYRRSIFVIFAGGYDINHWLMYGLDRDLVAEIATGATVEFENNGEWFSIEYRARKSLSVKRGKIFKQNAKGKWITEWASKITVWDVFGFFQESFIGVMAKWLGIEHKHFQLIKRMKGLRGDFEHVEQKEINTYNEAELSCLVELMQQVHAGISGLGLKCMRWDGAGAVAASMFRLHKIRESKSADVEKDNLTPSDIARREAVATAYAGGRIELCKIGKHEGKVYDYDVNSAYPSVMVDCPCLAHGQWVHTLKRRPAAGSFSVVRLRFRFDDGQRFYPLFYRTKHMQISFPAEGEGWYWLPEVEAAFLCPGEIDILEAWTFEKTCAHKPFAWIAEYYATRKQWLKNPSALWQSGGEKIIKLGLNSLYGKTAQQLGSRDGQAPAYHQLEWAGYITSATRARLYTAAIKNPCAIIGFATDGIFADKPLPIEVSNTKQLGAWELKTPIPTGLTVAMAGVYWWHLHDGTYSHFSRGFDKDAMKAPNFILKAWNDGKDNIDIPMYRLIGMGQASKSDIFWQMRGRFVESVRNLDLTGHSHKRRGIDIKSTKPHLGLVDLEVSPNIEYAYGEQGCSHPYPLKWLTTPESDNYQDALELEADANDADHI